MDFLPYRLFKQSFSLLTVSGDSPEPWQFLFQDPATPIMAGIINLHHDLMFILNFIMKTKKNIMKKFLNHKINKLN